MANYVEQFVAFFRHLLKFHKLKILTGVLSVPVFLILLFPYGDLGNYITTKITEISGNQIFLEFEDLGVSFFPQPGLQLNKVQLDMPFLDRPLTATELDIAPSITGLLSFRPGVSVHAQGLFAGALGLTTRGGDMTTGGVRRQIISVDAEELSLPEIVKAFDFSIPFRGSLAVDTKMDIDPSMNENPDGDIQFTIDQFGLPTSSISGFNIPQLSISQLAVKGRMKEGKLFVDEMKIGNQKDDISGTINGNLVMNIRGGGFANIGMYELNVDLTIKNSFRQRGMLMFELLDGFIREYHSKTFDGIRYKFKVTGTSLESPPRLSR